jgi:hypothetical protein
MAQSRGSAARSGGRSLGWLPWLIGALVLLGGLTAIDLAFYRDDIQDEAHEEEGGHTEGTEGGRTEGTVDESGDEDHGTDTGTNLEEPRDEDAAAANSTS